MAVLTLQAHTAAPRHECTRRAANAIQAAGGFVTDVRQFSNAALMLRFEVPATALPAMGAGLAAAGVGLDAVSESALADRALSGGEVDGTLHLRFYHGEPDLRIPTPAVPG